MLTCNEIYHILGLNNPDEFAENRFKTALDKTNPAIAALAPEQLADWSRRRSGRSTKTYIELISYLSSFPSENVYFMCPSTGMCRAHIDNIKSLIEKINKAKNINLDYKKIIPVSSKDQLEWIDCNKIFYDHYYFEYINV